MPVNTGGDKILIPFSYLGEWTTVTRKVYGEAVDPSNITGARLAEIGRKALIGQAKEEIGDLLKSGKARTIEEAYRMAVQQLGEPPEEQYTFYDRKTRQGDYTDVGWLDMRVDEICKRGSL